MVPEKFPRAEALHQELVVASTVVLMDIGLEIALLVTGRTNVIDVETGVTSRGTARTLLRSSGTVLAIPFILIVFFLEVLVRSFNLILFPGGTKVTQDHQFGQGLGLLVEEEEALAEAEATAVAVATGSCCPSITYCFTISVTSFDSNSTLFLFCMGLVSQSLEITG